MTANTEQEQADLLAAWLADPDAPVPEGLHHDVVEAVIALHPERAPAPRVTAESILAGVRTGPLAENSGELVAAQYVTPTPANRPWALAAMIAGSSGVIVAALALLTVGTLVATQQQESAPGRTAADGVAAAPVAAQRDTGLPLTDAVAASRAATPRPAPAPTRPGSVAEVPEPSREEPSYDAVAIAEPTEEDGGDFEDAVGGEGLDRDLDAQRQFRGGGGAGASVAAKGSTARPSMAPPPPPAAPGPTATPTVAPSPRPAAMPADDASADDFAQTAELARKQAEAGEAENQRNTSRRRDEEARALAADTIRESEADESIGYEPSASAGRAAPEQAEAKMKASKDERAKKEKEREKRSERAQQDQPASAPAAQAPIPEVVGGALAVNPKTGTSGVVDADVTRARTALAAGDTFTAMNAITVGLGRNPGDTRVRQLLLALQGDTYAAQGDQNAANQAYQRALEIAARLQ